MIFTLIGYLLGLFLTVYIEVKICLYLDIMWAFWLQFVAFGLILIGKLDE